MKYPNRFSWFKIASFVFIPAFIQCSSSLKSTKSNPPAETVFFDDFSGASLDRSKWNLHVTGQAYNDEQQAYIDSSATIYTVKGNAAEGASNGALVIHPRFSPGFITADGKKFDFLSSRIHTKGKFDFTYGTAAARIKMPEGKGLWPAWWLLGNGDWPGSGEIDIMEFVGESEWINSAIHGPGYSGNTPFVKRDSSFISNPVTNWHIYSVDWTPDSLIFKVDGRAFYTVTKAMIQKYGKWTFDIPKHLILNFALGGSYPGGVNNIKQPYFGLPASTVDLIKEGKIKLLVDWVSVTKSKK
ncbi:MAG: glcA 1 [Segetibacter sp.]|jgi:beta-glucanase (GH16 family)|nr:glcA 1 [Segetibacter sp.]